MLFQRVFTRALNWSLKGFAFKEMPTEYAKFLNRYPEVNYYSDIHYIPFCNQWEEHNHSRLSKD